MYEEVDEEQYSKLVRDRQEDDWIVDDGESQSVSHLQVQVCVCDVSLPFQMEWAMLKMEGRSLMMIWMMMLWKTKVNKHGSLCYTV